MNVLYASARSIRRRRRGRVVLWGARRYDRQFGGIADRAYEAEQRRIEAAVKRIALATRAVGLTTEEAIERMTEVAYAFNRSRREEGGVGWRP